MLQAPAQRWSSFGCAFCVSVSATTEDRGFRSRLLGGMPLNQIADEAVSLPRAKRPREASYKEFEAIKLHDYLKSGLCEEYLVGEIEG